jgi:predicted Zn-dependent protease
VADALFIEAHVAWERTEWSRVFFLFRQVTTLQPRAVLFWDMAAWHMAWNASTAAMNDPSQPRLALRTKAAREYLRLGKDFLERGIKNNPDRPELYEALARLYRDKYEDHEHASEFFAKAAALPGAHRYTRRFAAYELAQCPGRERDAYAQLRALYDSGEQERLPTLLRHLKELEIKLEIPPDQRVP